MERIDKQELLACKGGSYLFGLISRIVLVIASSLFYRWRR